MRFARVRKGTLFDVAWDVWCQKTRQQNQLLLGKRLSDAGKRGSWKRWHREQVILSMLPMVEKIARDVRWMFARHIDVRDLVQAGSLGLLKAANAYHPSKGAFEAFAYFYVRGHMIDSQKRRTYREESHTSLQAIADPEDGWIPPKLDTDTGPLPDEIARRRQIEARMAAGIAALPEVHRRVLQAHLAGQSLTSTARRVGLSLTWTRTKLREAREAVGVAVRGE